MTVNAMRTAGAVHFVLETIIILPIQENINEFTVIEFIVLERTKELKVIYG